MTRLRESFERLEDIETDPFEDEVRGRDGGSEGGVLRGMRNYLKFAILWVRFASCCMELFRSLLALPKNSECLMFYLSGWA